MDYLAYEIYLPPLLRFSPNNSILVEIKPYRYDILYRQGN